MKCNTQIISHGIALGKAKFLKVLEQENIHHDNHNQLELFHTAVKAVNDQLDVQIKQAETNFSDRITEIFVTHKFIVNDPLIIEPTEKRIEQGLSAQESYKETVDHVLSDFSKIQNEYMLGRIVDILDATDKVKVQLNSIHEEVISDEIEDTILVLKNLKPSIIFELRQSNIKGFIASEGVYTQHSGIIAREIKIPGMVCPEIVKKIQENDFIIIDSDNELVIINPDEDTLQKYQKEEGYEL